MRSSAALAVVALLLLVTGLTAHAYADPYEPGHQHDYQLTHESTEQYELRVGDDPGEVVASEELSPVAREFLEHTLATGDPPDRWGDGEEGYRSWQATVCSDAVVVCVGGYEDTPEEFEYSPATGAGTVIDHDGDHYLLVPEQTEAVTEWDLRPLFALLGMLLPGAALGVAALVAHRLPEPAAGVLAGVGALLFAWGHATPYLAMLGLSLDGLRSGGAAVGVMVALGALVAVVAGGGRRRGPHER